MSGEEDLEGRQRNFAGPYTSHHPIPTVQRYREEKKERVANAGDPDGSSGHVPYEDERKQEQTQAAEQGGSSAGGDLSAEGEEGGIKDTSETTEAASDPKQQRKQMKKKSDDRAEREVTDPVTHLRVGVHDFTNKDLKEAPENEPHPGAGDNTTTGDRAQDGSEEQLSRDRAQQQEAHDSLHALFPPPDFEATRQQISSIYQKAVTAGVTGIFVVMVLISFSLHFVSHDASISKYSILTFIATITLLLGAGVIWGAQDWARKKIEGAWENEVWEAERQQGKEASNSHRSETTQWLNSVLASVWPLVNPDLFTSIADTLEDVMQASLPRMVRMISVEDIGQGSESLRILGVKWLPTGAAAKSVSKNGKLKSGEDSKKSDRTVPGQGEVQKDDSKEKSRDDGEENSPEEEENDENVAEGMEAESGDFINLEVAFSYRSRGQGKSMHNRAKNAHLYLAFYLYAGIKFPVWVEVHGVIGVMRLRLQLTPDPPFFSLCTMTFLGQPKIDLSCIPLSKHGLNIMDLPLISRFVQSAVDAGLSTLVAPRNLTLDLKEMLIGDDFKKDTSARGVLVVRIKRGFDFKEGDAGIPIIKDGSADPYVSVGWAKFGKPVWSTRVLLSEMEPVWDETAYILVTPEELNVDERLRVQLWDSDRTSADDDLGRIEVDLKHIMRDSRSNGKMWAREDGFRALKKGETMPGKLQWEIGYFSKARILDSQLAEQTEDPDVKNVEQLKQKVYEESERKLREAKHDESAEIEQQKQQDLKEREDQLLTGAPPPQEYPSGIISIQIHQITGLELEAINKNQANKNDTGSDEEEGGDDLPSSYCTIILNHQKIFRTRTKPKNGKPFFNAGTERFIRDWRNAEIHISVRDSRVHEDDPLLGMIYLPLGDILAKRSQVNEIFPLSGGVGYGKARVSLVFRSVQLQAPPQALGWENGTLDINPVIKASDDLPHELKSMRLKIKSNLGKGKLSSEDQGSWKSKNGKPVRIPVQKRYSTPLVVEFRSNSSLRDSTEAFAILWMKDIVDDEEQTFTLPVWKGDLKRAKACVLDEPGEKVGAIELELSYLGGFSGYHAKLASKDKNIADVMEVLDAANDNDDMDMNYADGDSESDSSSDSDDDGQKQNGSGGDDGSRGTIDSLKDFKNNRKQLHRRNRGLMQWKGTRTAKWMKGKVEDGHASVTSLFKHHDRDTGIETEA